MQLDQDIRHELRINYELWCMCVQSLAPWCINASAAIVTCAFAHNFSQSHE